MTDTIKPSLVPPSERRRPALAYEQRIVESDTGGSVATFAVVNVPLAGGVGQAQIDLADFNAIMEQGLSDQWWWHPNGKGRGYVRTARVGEPKKMATVARLITGGRFGTQVRYQDGNSLNLRRVNLVVGQGFSKGYEGRVMREVMWEPHPVHPGEQGAR